ncbi:MAG: ATP-binding protein [Myxococcota bacterium]
MDDSEIVLAFLTAELVDAGYLVETATNGASGITVVGEWHPDVVLCDLKMPGLSGYDVVEALKEKAPLTPVVIFTDSDDLRCAVEAMRRGACGYLVKGQEPGVLLGEVERALARRRVLERNRELEAANLRYQRELEQMVEMKTREIARLEAARAQADRLAAMGSFVAGIAHEVNNPLAVIKANGQFLWRVLAEEGATIDSQALEALSELRTCTQRIQEIVAGLKRFSWQGTAQEQCELKEVLDEVKLLCRERTPPTVRCEWLVSPDVQTVAMPRGDLVLVLSNLCVNAAHAVEATGRPGTVTVRVERRGPDVTLAVRDDGTGIPPELLQRIFDPFFTTKPPGKGSGLGLALVRQVVQNAGGSIDVESTLGSGTTFRLTVPAALRGAGAA